MTFLLHICFLFLFLTSNLYLPVLILISFHVLRIVFSHFEPRGNNFFSKIFLIKVCHPINEQLEHIWFSLMLTLWCLGQKREAPKASVALGAPLWGYFPPFAPRGNNFFSKIFLLKVSRFINEQMEHIWFSLMLTLWCLFLAG